ncbi:MAG TPA: XRE family transcriptional regulator [Candidatus Eisenbacteria bacterium]
MSAATGVALGRRIRQIRIEKGLTLKQIEARVGISATHVSEVERGRTSPTVGALARIAEALGVRPSHLIDFPIGRHRTVTREGKRALLTMPDRRIDTEILVPSDPAAEISVFVVTLAASFADGVPGEARTGDKLFHILEGAADLVIGEKVMPLEAGDTIHIRSNHAHRLVNRFQTPCRILWALWPRMTI